MKSLFYKFSVLITFCFLFSESTLASNDYVRLTGHVPSKQISQAQLTGHSKSDKKLSLVVALPIRNKASFDNFLRSVYDPQSPLYRKFLTPAEFKAQYSPNQADYDAVANHFMSKGFVVKNHENLLLLEVAGPVSAIENTFQINLNEYKNQNSTFYAPDADPALPQSIATKVNAVLGLDNAVVLKPHFKQASVSPNATTGNYYYANNLKDIYNFNGIAATGSGQTVAIVSFGGGLYGNFDSTGLMLPDTTSDVYNYQNSIGLSTFPSVVLKLLNGATNNTSDLNSTIENTLDVSMVGATAPGSTIVVYEGPNTGSQFVTTLDYIASTPVSVNGNNLLPQVVNISWGSAESNYGSTALAQIDNSLAVLAAQGVSVFVASGDNGSSDGLNGNNVDFPSSSPHVTSTGGTSLVATYTSSAWTYVSETAWSGSGGGASSYFNVPTFQYALPATSYRNVPDIASSADPSNGTYFLINNTTYIIGGTSEAAPFWTGFNALVNQQLKTNALPPTGLLAPSLYSLAGSTTNYSSDFHDITAGSNGGYTAVSGYDRVTGFGTLNATNLFNQLTHASQTITFGAAPAISYLGTGTVTATSTSGLTVTFTSATPSVCSVSGSTVTDLIPGTCVIVANQAGNASFNAAQVTQSISIQNASLPQTITFGPAPKLSYKGNGTLSATSTSNLPVKFTSTTPLVCSVTSATVKSVAGCSCVIAANQAGNSVYAVAPQVTQTITVQNNPQTMSFTSASVTYSVSKTLPISVPTNTSASLPITYTSSNTNYCSVSNGKITCNKAGIGHSVTMKATQTGNACYAPVTVSKVVTITL